MYYLISSLPSSLILIRSSCWVLISKILAYSSFLLWSTRNSEDRSAFVSFWAKFWKFSTQLCAFQNISIRRYFIPHNISSYHYSLHFELSKKKKKPSSYLSKLRSAITTKNTMKWLTITLMITLSMLTISWNMDLITGRVISALI